MKKVILFGLGYFEKELLKAISATRSVIAVDIRKEYVETLKQECPEPEYVIGDASSILTWKKLPIEDVSHIITTIRDVDVNLEVCRIAREHYKLEIPIVILSYSDVEEEPFQQFNPIFVKPLELGVEIVSSIIEKNYARPVNIGLKKGEILEVSVLSNSHLVGRKLKLLRPKNWSVAIAYRDGEIIVPSGEFFMKIGDRVVLVGVPKVLQNLVNILTKGVPQFPLQFGQNINVPVKSVDDPVLDEAMYLQQKTMSRFLDFLPFDAKLVDDISLKLLRERIPSGLGEVISNYRQVMFREDAGLTVLPAPRFTIFNSLYRFFFHNAMRPFLLSRGSAPYERIVVSLNTSEPSVTLETGMEIANLLKIPFTVIYVTMPREMRGEVEEEALIERRTLISDFALTGRVKIDYQVLEGNPVKQTAAFLNGGSAKTLLILAYDKERTLSFLSPHTQYLIAGRVQSSVLCIPLEDGDDQV